MSLDTEQIKQVAHLARLEFSAKKLPQFANEFNQIIDLVNTISETDTSTIKPLYNPLEQTQRFRTDEINEPNERDKMQSSAPETDLGLYLVPKVIE